MVQIRSFDRTECIDGLLFRPDRYRQLFSLLSHTNSISRGAGLSYCNAGASSTGGTILATEFNRFIEFNPERKIVRVESGVTLGELLNFAIARSLIPPVLAGHPRITVGGAIAMNIHGKNQFRLGNFGNHVRRLALFHPSYGELECSPNDNAELFQLTLGGFGLTGHIVSADIALYPLPATTMVVERHSAGDLAEAIRLMEELSGQADHLYSWHDFNRLGKQFGRGTIYLERYIHSQTSPSSSTIRDASIDAYPMPWPLLNRLSIPAMCRLYDWNERITPRLQELGLREAMFPILGKEMYFRLFGPSGFREYQALFPRHTLDKAARQIATAIKDSSAPISLASLKLFSGERHFINFAGSGICLALNTPNSASSLDLFGQLDRIVIDAGGIANIAKDSRLNATTVQAMYGDGYDQFRNALRAYDPGLHFQSELRRRLDV